MAQAGRRPGPGLQQSCFSGGRFRVISRRSRAPRRFLRAGGYIGSIRASPRSDPCPRSGHRRSRRIGRHRQKLFLGIVSRLPNQMRKDQGRGPECRRLFPDGRWVGVVVLDECVRPSIMLNQMPRSPHHLRSRPSRQPRHRPGCPWYQGVPGNGNDPIGRFGPIANRLADALDRWAFSSITASPGARAFYGRRRSEGDSHNKALRALANHWVGILHGCLDHRTLSGESTAQAHRIDTDVRWIAQAA